jgi:pimeloyl-ACP methyl ester carboxylesterase
VESVEVNGVELKHEAVGSGEPMLLISPVLADGFLPLLSEPALVGRYQLGLPRAHFAGHSSGAAVAAQGTRTSRKGAYADPAGASAALGAQRRGLPQPGRSRLRGVRRRRPRGRIGHVHLRRERARLADVRSRARGAHARLGGAGDQGREDLIRHRAARPDRMGIRPEQAPAVDQPVLSVLGSETEPLWVEVADFLRSSLADVEECTIDGVGHLLHSSPSLEKWPSSWSETP